MASETTKTATNSRLLAVGALVLLIGVVLVLLIVRGDVGAAPQSAEASSDAASQGDDAATTGVAERDPETATRASEVDELDEVRLPVPPEVPEGAEAVAVRVAFDRGLGGIPQPGDRINLYTTPERDDEADDEDDGEDAFEDREDAEAVLDDVEVLGLSGPLPTQNDGELTFLLAVEEPDVPALLPAADSGRLWFTLQPTDDAGEDSDTEAADAEAAADSAEDSA